MSSPSDHGLIVEHDGVLVQSSEYIGEYIWLNTAELNMDILVKTPHKYFTEFLENCEATMSREDAARMFKKVWAVIKKTDINKIYDVQSAWSNFCDDIAIFFTLRWILFKKPVPIVKQNIVKTLKREGYEDPVEID